MIVTEIRARIRRKWWVYVEGRLQTRKWQDQNGIDRYTTEIIANVVQNLTPRSDGGGSHEQPPLPPEPQGGFGGTSSSTGEDVPF